MGMQEYRGMGGGGNRWKMRELAKNEHMDWPILKRALKAFLPYWPHSIIVTVVILATSIGGVMPAWMTQKIIDDGINKNHMTVIVWYTIALILVALLNGLIGVLQTWLSNKIAQSVMADYRMSIFQHLQKQTVHFFASRQAGDLVSHVTNDVTLYNFCMIYKTKDGQRLTPAQRMGLTDKKFSMKDIIYFLMKKYSQYFYFINRNCHFRD